MDKATSMTSSLIGSNKKTIEMVATALILLHFAPFEVLGAPGLKLRSMLGPIVDPITSLMSNVFVRGLLFVVLAWSCCMMKDMNLFFILAIYFIVSERR